MIPLFADGSFRPRFVSAVQREERERRRNSRPFEKTAINIPHKRNQRSLIWFIRAFAPQKVELCPKITNLRQKRLTPFAFFCTQGTHLWALFSRERVRDISNNGWASEKAPPLLKVTEPNPRGQNVPSVFLLLRACVSMLR